MSLCKRGWHRVGPQHEPTHARFATRMRDEHGTCIYRIGPQPRDGHCRTIWCYGDKGVPWTCVACGRPIDRPDSPAMLAHGPAGVIGISYPNDEGDIVLPSIVWPLR